MGYVKKNFEAGKEAAANNQGAPSAGFCKMMTALIAVKYPSSLFDRPAAA
jgi:hypothetical protein